MCIRDRSKDFRPSEVKKILNQSLQVLTDDDLSAMVSTMEQMDNLEDTLQGYRAAIQDARIISREYTRYNQYMLGQKGQAYLNAQGKAQSLRNQLQDEQARRNALEQQLTTRRITVHDFLNNEEAQKDFLENMLDTMLYMMRKNTVTGSFLILANDSVGTQESTCDGIYFRDSDPTGNPADYADVLLERGASSFSHAKGIPLDTLWTTSFHLGKSGELSCDDFFFKPYEAAKLYPDTDYRLSLIHI